MLYNARMSKKPRKKTKIAIVVVIVALVAWGLFGLLTNTNASKSSSLIKSATYKTNDEIVAACPHIGVLTGTIFGAELEKNYPDAQVSYYSSYSDMVVALKKGRIDAILGDEPIIGYMASETPGMAYVDDPLVSTDIAFAFPKNDGGYALKLRFDAYFAKLSESGKLDALKTKWLGGEIIGQTEFDYNSLPATNGVLSLATQLTTAPFGMMIDNKATGLELEIAYEFCEEYGYGLKINDVTFDGILAGLSACKYDFGASSISITEEREQNMLFSTPYLTSDGVFVYMATQEDVDASAKTINSLNDLYDARVGVMVGTTDEKIARQYVGPEGEVLTFNAMSDLPLALDMGKIDAYINDESYTRQLLNEYPYHRVVDADVDTFECGFILQKNNARSEKLCLQINTFLEKAEADGTLDQYRDKWVNKAQGSKVIVDRSVPLTGKNGTIKYAICTAAGAPFCYVQDKEFQGYEIEIMYAFCQEYGYELELTDLEFTGLLVAVSSGKYDVGGCGLTITAERQQSLLFTSPCLEGHVYCVTSDSTESKNFIEATIASFRSTLLLEDRWQLFLTGVINTLIITFGALIFGTLLGFFAYMRCRNGGSAAQKVVDFCSWFITGMPTVVLLMVLFYVIFAQLPVSGIFISIIGFALIFAASVVGMLRTGVDAVDRGQEEAALALGYTRSQAFYKIVLPQAIQHVAGIFESEVVTLLKGTAIVGYIAIQDLTKMGDIVRSRTFEAFFPLAFVALLYFVMAAIIKRLIRLAARRLNSHNRKPEDILKGVDTHD